MRSRFAACAIAPFVLATLGSCSNGTTGTDPASTPQRLVVLAPAAAEMLESLDLVERVVAVGEFGPWPSGLADLPVAGGYASPNVEVVLALGADAVVTTESAAAHDAHGRLEALGIEVIALVTGTYEGVFASLLRVGGLFQRLERARRVERAMRDELREIEKTAAALSPRRVLVVVGRDPLYVAGPGSHLDQMIATAGGTNVAGDVLSSYQQMSLETVLERMPEIIIDTSTNAPGAPRGRILGDWARWEFLPAVQSNRVYQIDPSQLVIPGMRLPAMTRVMAQLIHPEAFGEATAESFGPYSETSDAATP